MLITASNYHEIVTLCAQYDGKEEQFQLHAETVYHHSPVLKAAFDGPWLEGKSKLYQLEDTTPDSVRHLGTWLYTQQLSPPIVIDSRTTSQFVELNGYRRVLVDLWVLADKLIIPSLQSTTLMLLETLDLTIYAKWHNQTTPYRVEDINYILDDTMPESPLQFARVKV